MDQLLTVLRSKAYENWANGVMWDRVDVANFISEHVYLNPNFTFKGFYWPDLKICMVFYFLCEEDARFDL